MALDKSMEKKKQDWNNMKSTYLPPSKMAIQVKWTIDTRHAMKIQEIEQKHTHTACMSYVEKNARTTSESYKNTYGYVETTPIAHFFPLSSPYVLYSTHTCTHTASE